MFINIILFIIYPATIYFISKSLILLLISYILSIILFLLIQNLKKSKYIILDTSVISDARIVDIINSNLFEKFILPRFVIKDIEEKIERTKNKVLETNLEKIKENKKVKVLYKNYFNIKSTEIKTIKLAKSIKAKIMTNNFDLTKSSIMQNIKIIDINDLHERLKPIVLPGYIISVFLVKEGKEKQQAIGFLEDGTTVIVDYAKSFIGKRVNIEITSSLHSSTNKILFAKLQKENNIQEVI